MGDPHLLIVLAVAAPTLVAVAVLRRAGVPAPVVLVLAGLVVGFLPFVPDVALDPEVVLLGLLPLLVFDAAVTASPTAFAREAAPIAVLAVVLVVATAGAVAAVAHAVAHLPWAICFVLGTAVGPTDAAAATSVARRLGLPRALTSVIEGEALFNDATALVLYAAAVTAATTGRFSAGHTALAVVGSVLAGVGIGLAVGVVGRWARNRVDDAPVEIAASIFLAYAAYLPAEAVGASGVLAAVTAGLYLGWHSSGGAFSARSRLQSAAFWDTLVFLVEGVLFVLVGLSFHTFTVQAGRPLGQLVAAGAAVVAVVVVVRLVVVAAARPLLTRHRRGTAGWRERAVVGWSGMRGAITLAALLAVPASAAGRDDIVYLGFAVIVVTLVGQGLTLPALVRRLGLREHPAVADAGRLARREMTEAALAYLGDACQDDRLPAEVVDGLRAQYAARLSRIDDLADEDAGRDAVAELGEEVALRRELIGVQRRRLIGLRDEGRIGTSTLRALERDLDLEESRLQRR